MNTVLTLELIGMAVLLACSAFFSSAETALFSLNLIHVHRLRRRWPRQAGYIEKLLAAPQNLLSTILIGNTLVNIAASTLAFVIFDVLFPGYGEALTIPVMTIVLLLFGEVTPKRLAMAHADRLAVAYAPVLQVLVKLLTPLRIALDFVASAFHRNAAPRKVGLTEDEFLTVVEVGEEEGVLDEEERTMVDGIIGLEETQASDIMTPRVDLVGIDLDDPFEECLKTAAGVKFRYLPLYRDTLDQPEGFLDVPRFLLAEQPDVQAAMVPPFYVPETMPLDALLTTMQREHRRVAFVVDEFGGTAGLVTRGDILEEIVDDVDNEYGESKVELEQVGDNRWIADGTTSLEDINYELDMTLAAEGADRIAGWCSAVLERLPRTGEVIESQGCRVTVLRVRRRRIALVQIEKTLVADAGEGDAP